MIVDDHVLFREGLAAIIRQEPDVEIVGMAGTVREAVELASMMRPEIILMDFGLPDGTGVDATRAIIELLPQCKIVYLTVYEDDENLLAGVRSGAKGYLLKNMRPAKLMAAVRSVYQGESALSRTMTLRLMEELAQIQPSSRFSAAEIAKLTTRELDVLRALTSGATNQQIGHILFLSENTVKHYIHSILDKLNITNRREAANFAREHGLVNP